MKKVFYLKTCQTNKKIMNLFNLTDWTLQEIKSTPISEKDLEKMKKLAGSYQSLFSKKSTQIKNRNLNISELNEEDFKNLILDHYSFLKRPVFMTDTEIFIGNEKSTIEKLHQFFGTE